jgi:FAD dependent oxidoreductase TIGR03364
MQSSDLVVVGAGIIGLAHALAGARAGLSVTVLDRDAQANGASIRNFGFVTVTGQEAGATWRRARRARDVWAEIAPAAGIAVHHRGTLLACRRPQALAVAEEFCDSPMGAGCRILDRSDLAAHPALQAEALVGALYSPHELRVESRDAIPRLAAHLEQKHGVRFHRLTAVHAVEPGRVLTSAGAFAAPHIVVCPGPDIVTLFPEIFAKRGTTLCKLHMMRVAPPGWRLPAAVMSDLGLHRYLGYAACPSLPALRARLKAEQAQELADGVHLIVVQGADGSLVVGDSHHYGPTPDPFQPEAVDALILRELRAVLNIPEPRVVERWTGLYPSGPQTAFFEAPMQGVRLVSVTSGTGASTGFGLAEEVMADLLGTAPPAWATEDATA